MHYRNLHESIEDQPRLRKLATSANAQKHRQTKARETQPKHAKYSEIDRDICTWLPKFQKARRRRGPIPTKIGVYSAVAAGLYISEVRQSRMRAGTSVYDQKHTGFLVVSHPP